MLCPSVFAATSTAPVTLPRASWWELRPASNRKPATYRCPICDRFLPALSAHMLLYPDGDARRRRHAHTECVLRARAAGRLPLKEDRDAQSPVAGAWWRRLLGGPRGR
jgi:hypothetical protein